MILKMLMSQTGTDKDYKEVLKKRIGLCYVVVVLGLSTLGLALFFSSHLSSFLSGVYTGIGAGLIGAGIALIIKMKRVLKDEKKIKQKRLSEQDERNIMINQKAVQASTIVILVLAYLGLMVSGIFNLIVFWTLWVVVAVFMVVFVIFSFYYNKKY
ncbi:hypothetical protein [Clostridium cellulovorans]|uniref:DUF2178 domain-containing protein n=1 Tax=Clostridium cellulovorans (strain ATCC 35296 / DSM 3052 / OCM 3 / 743B) TaxID=573061 RepID=D9SQH7_CLOC7|nr:hypothetical protein [Clostridium cellulovorans]ADL50244.1 hypothetical protein Clocel_0468 [Clostridium cellulovorans 743B]